MAVCGGTRLLGEKFSCLICGQEDLTEDEMRSHVLLEHVECNICCPFCDLSGITNDEMTLHINKVHFDDLMSPIEKSKEKENGAQEEVIEVIEEKDNRYTGREDVDKFGEEHGGAIPKVLKHSQSLDQGSRHQSPKRTSGLKSSLSETNISKRGKLQLNFSSINGPAPSPSLQSIKSSSSHTLRSSVSSNTIKASTSAQSFTGSSSYEGFNSILSGNNNEEMDTTPVLTSGRLRFQNNNHSDVIMEEPQGQENNNLPLQPNLNQTLLPDINHNIEPDINSNMPAGFSCPLCQFITASENVIQNHVNMAHVDILSPAQTLDSADGAVGATRRLGASIAAASDTTVVQEDVYKNEYPCPICMRIFNNSGELSLHVNQDHSSVFSPDKYSTDIVVPSTSYGADLVVPGTSSCAEGAGTSGLMCPVCEHVCHDRFKLQAHVNGHFSAEQTPVQEKTDKLIAQELQEKEKDLMKHKEKTEFQKLQAMYGMVDGTPYRKQYERNLERAVASGDLSVVEFHERKTGLKQADSRGIDDGSSYTKGVIQRLQEYYRTRTHGVTKSWLCTSVDHYSASYGDKGWGCGYRNFQMLLSSLMADPSYLKTLFNGKPMMPSVPKIQRLIESAWEKGFDKQGCDQLGGRIFNTTKWIGATEIVATLASLKVRCRLLDFHNPSGPDGTHPKLFQWVKEYFEKPAVFKPPLYLQHQGHSRTIVGIEELKDKKLRLLIFDPSTPKKQMILFHSIVNANIMRTLRRTEDGLKAKQYQIVAVCGTLNDKQYEESKVLKSERLS